MTTQTRSQVEPIMTLPITNRAERIAPGRLMRGSVIAIVGAAAGNLIVRAVAIALGALPPDYQPLGVGSILGISAVGVAGAVGVLLILARFTQRPIRLFKIIAAVVVAISVVGHLLLLSNPPGIPLFAGITGPIIATMIVMWLVTPIMIVGGLTIQHA